MRKAISKEEMALLKEAGEMFNETGCVPGNDGEQVPAERMVPDAKEYILESIVDPEAVYDSEIWNTPGFTLEPIAKLPSGNWDSGSSRLAKIARRVFCKPALDHGAVDAMHWQFLDAARLCGVSSVSNWAAHGSRSDDQSQELIAGQRQDAEHQVA